MRLDPLADYFLQYFVEETIIDVEQVQVVPTWHNPRGGRVGMPRILDQFFMEEQIVK